MSYAYACDRCGNIETGTPAADVMIRRPGDRKTLDSDLTYPNRNPETMRRLEICALCLARLDEWREAE